jgi:predicted RNA methylase
VLERTLGGLRRALERLRPRPVESAWSGYMEDGSTYDAAVLAQKERFVRETFDRHRPRTVLDVGCNTGHFSALAAEAGARVVAVDKDPEVAGATFRRAAARGLDVLPLAVDLARPSPAVGWRNLECPPFLARAEGHFEGVLMLALVHHLTVTERVPLEEIAVAAARLCTSFAIVEWVDPEDPMFRRLLRGRDALFAGLGRERFEAALRPHFEVARREDLGEMKRTLYALVRRSGGH